MSETLAVKYRPQTFEEVVEQDLVKGILINQIKTGQIKGAYLFEGPAGCGKTTSARLFAKAVNGSEADVIEVNAASNNSVDDVRRISEGARYQSMSSKYKVYILDECFHGETLISTPQGFVPIKCVKQGDTVLNMMGASTVTHVHKNRVLTSRLCCVTINGVRTFTTTDHLYFTKEGWVEASNLRKGDIVYVPSYMRGVWKGIFKQAQGSEVLLKFLCSQGDGPAEAEEARHEILLGMWEAVLNNAKQQNKDLLQGMQEYIDSALKSQYVVEYATRGEDAQSLFLTHEVGQPYEESKYDSEDAGGEGIERLLAYLEGTEGWKRAIHEATNNVVGSVGKEACIRIRHPNECEARDGLPDVLQSRPCLSRREIGGRGGWEGTPMEKWYSQGPEENESVGIARVEGAEVYQRGDNDELFRRGFTDTELQGEYVDMYDLEVEGHHSYFANGALVHNCHLLSASAWGALLKTLEEPPANTIFILCTTDAQKIPQTIISRVQAFRFTKISLKGIQNRLDEICYEEYGCYPFPKEAVDYIAKQAQGGMRDAISLMGKVLDALPQGFVKEDDCINVNAVVYLLGLVDYDVMAQLARALLFASETTNVADVVQGIYDQGKDLKLFLKNFTSFALDMVVFYQTGDISKTMLPPTDEWAQTLSGLCHCPGGLEALRRVLEATLDLAAEVKWDNQPKTVIIATYTLLRMEVAA